MTDSASYNLFGLQVHSELPLPDLMAGDGVGERVDVTFGSVTHESDHVGTDRGAALVLSIPEVARFEIEGGTRIVIDPAPRAGERELRVFLLGSAFGALLHQRGLLPLHSNSIELEGHAVAFLGRSGAGKSTLAHWFHCRGLTVLADDVSAISLSGPAIALPGVPRLRLWQDALEAAGLGDAGFPRSFAGQEKFDVPACQSVRRPLPLGACYLLDEATEGQPPSVSQLSKMDAVEAIMANTYRGRFVALLGRSERHLDLCLRLAERVPVFRASRLWGSIHFENQSAKLMEHATKVICGLGARDGLLQQIVEDRR